MCQYFIYRGGQKVARTSFSFSEREKYEMSVSQSCREGDCYTRHFGAYILLLSHTLFLETEDAEDRKMQPCQPNPWPMHPLLPKLSNIFSQAHSSAKYIITLSLFIFCVSEFKFVATFLVISFDEIALLSPDQ